MIWMAGAWNISNIRLAPDLVINRVTTRINCLILMGNWGYNPTCRGYFTPFITGRGPSHRTESRLKLHPSNITQNNQCFFHDVHVSKCAKICAPKNYVVLSTKIWWNKKATSHDLTWPHGGLVREMGPLISGKSRLVKYYNLAILIFRDFFINQGP